MSAISFDPLTLIERLLRLAQHPRADQLNSHGMPAPVFAWRDLVVPKRGPALAAHLLRLPATHSLPT